MVTPDAVAVIVKAPEVPFAVKDGEVAKPLESVVTVAVVDPLLNVTLAPEEGAVKVTETPLLGVPPVDTVATKGAANVAPVTALCPEPLVVTIVSTGGGGVLLPPPQAPNAAIRTTHSALQKNLRFIGPLFVG